MLRYLRDTAVFAPCYLLLDWVSYIDPLGPFNITPWNPQPALAIVWMMLSGLSHAPVVVATVFLADVIIRGAPAGYAVTLLTALVLSAGYAAIAATLRVLLRPKPTLHTLGQLTVFVCIVAPGTAIIAAAFVGVLYGAGLLEPDAIFPGWLQFWIGDGVGVLVTAPLLLVVTDSNRRRSLRVLPGRPEAYVQVGLLAATLWLIFDGLGGDPLRHFYLLFLPLIWIAIRSGMSGAIVAVAIVQVGVVLGIHPHPAPDLPIIELQALVAALTLTGLFLGLMVDERERATEVLKQSLRLAAAGEMAGAIAHEVNQPLTALTNYGRSGQLLLAAGRTGELPGVIDRMLAEAQRAAEVVRRLRDFFRHGTTRLERVSLAELLERVRRTESAGRAGCAVPITLEVEPGLPDVSVDRLQIELVMRNLLSNALEAVEPQPNGGAIAVTARRADSRYVRIVVSDNGPGLRTASADRVFEPFVSGKPTGMGLGLAVSRAIVEAHGGTLEARFGSHGEFHVLLPVEATSG
jgi:two-component system, LuxR family, sensor kinase FixL